MVGFIFALVCLVKREISKIMVKKIKKLKIMTKNSEEIPKK
jgi:hypothetical protein